MERQITESNRSRTGSTRRVRATAGSAERVPPAPMGLVLGSQADRRGHRRIIRGLSGLFFLGLAIASLTWTTTSLRGVLDRESGRSSAISNWSRPRRGGLIDSPSIGTGWWSSSSSVRAARSEISTCPGSPRSRRRIATEGATSWRSTRTRASRSMTWPAMPGNPARDFSVLKDAENRVADQVLAERTCEALVLDRRHRLRYRGAIDDQYGRRTRRDQPERTFLADAIEAVLSGRRVPPETTQVDRLPHRANGSTRSAVGASSDRSPARRPGRRTAVILVDRSRARLADLRRRRRPDPPCAMAPVIGRVRSPRSRS